MFYQVDIKVQSGCNERKLAKALRILSPSLNLRQVSDLVRYLFSHGLVTLVAGVDLDVACHLKTQLAMEGVECTVSPSTIATPMVSLPSANAQWQWGWLRIVEKEN